MSGDRQTTRIARFPPGDPYRTTTVNNDRELRARRRAAVRTAIGVALIALMFYLAFIITTILR